MPIGSLERTASAMRTALVGRAMHRFDASLLIGPVPQAGRTVEMVEARGKHLEVVWDDGLVLDTHVKHRCEWHVYRPGDPWRRAYKDFRASIENDGFVAVCFNATNLETYRRRDRGRHPGLGRLGPDLTQVTDNLPQIVELLLSYPDPDARLRDVIVDQHVMQGLGNVYCCEVLWSTELSPWAHIGDLTHQDAWLIVNTSARLVRATAGRVRRLSSALPFELAVYGRTGQACARCHETIESRPVGRSGRTLYWCPGCQTRLDRRHATIDRDMDSHPAAARYLNDLPWRHTSSD